ncbi:MAG: Segregation and condensation protein A [Parcubacteria group bacterium GW2011_GWA2_42_14]|nr:MAG: Segregation and condensation protein A [Parcubacteria group bacterium GW2011_GWA2_42_14]
MERFCTLGYMFQVSYFKVVYTVKQGEFEGPLGLLLDLIEKEKLNINEVSLANVAEEYVKFVNSLENIDKEELAEFLVVAAQLILIKSRSLLPGLAVSEEEEVSIEELQKRLEEYKRLKELSKELRKIAESGTRIFTREFYAGMPSVFYPPKKVSPSLLQKIFEGVLNAIPKIEKLAEEKIRKIITLEEKIRSLRGLLKEKIERTFSEITKTAADKIEIIVSFLAILEMAKQKFLSLEQDKLFGEIKIKKE